MQRKIVQSFLFEAMFFLFSQLSTSFFFVNNDAEYSYKILQVRLRFDPGSVEPRMIAVSLADSNDYHLKRLALRFFYLSEETHDF